METARSNIYIIAIFEKWSDMTAFLNTSNGQAGGYV